MDRMISGYFRCFFYYTKTFPSNDKLTKAYFDKAFCLSITFLHFFGDRLQAVAAF